MARVSKRVPATASIFTILPDFIILPCSDGARFQTRARNCFDFTILPDFIILPCCAAFVMPLGTQDNL
jgi:hypothetical protein